MRIGLPKVQAVSSRPGAHSYPFQIGYQTLELMQASVFHATLFDEAAGQRVRQKNGVSEINGALQQMGLEPSIVDRGWKLLATYKPYFQDAVFRNVLISLRSHWDWFIGHNGLFILHGLASESQGRSNNKVRKLKRIGFERIENQAKILETLCGIQLELGPKDIAELKELSLVRNLGLHNRWEIDSHYLEHSTTTDWEIGHIRTFDSKELRSWHKALIALVDQASTKIAVRFVNAPKFEHFC